jgi:hypothetical protein
LVAAQGPSPAAESATFAAAAAAVDAFHVALKTGDRDAAQAFLDDKVEIFEQGWVERSKAEYASHHLGADIAFSGATTHTQTARGGAIVADLAYVTSEGRVAGMFKGKPIDSITTETMVLQRTPAGWKIVHVHWSSREAKKN